MTHLSLNRFALTLLVILCHQAGLQAADSIPSQVLRSATNIERSLSSQRGQTAQAFFDYPAFTRTVLKGLDVPPVVQNNTLKAVRGGIQKLFREIPAKLGPSGSYHLLRINRKSPQRFEGLYRMIGTAGINYHTFHFRLENKLFRITDIDILLSGEKLSQTMRRMVLPLVAHANRGILDRLLGAENTYIQHLKEIESFLKAQRNGRTQAALNIYKQLPQSLQDDRTFLLVYLQLLDAEAANGGRQASGYIHTVNRYRKLYPNDKNLDILLIDYYFMQNDYDAVLQTIDRLDRSLHDPYLNVIRGNAYQAMGKLDQAFDYWDKASSLEPELKDPYLMYLQLALQENDWPETTATLKVLLQNTGMYYDNMAQDPEFAKYIKSPEYPKYKAFLQTQFRLQQ